MVVYVAPHESLPPEDSSEGLNFFIGEKEHRNVFMMHCNHTQFL